MSVQEVHKYRSQVLRKEACQSSPTRKRQKVESSSTGDLTGVLDGLNVHIVHCKEDMTSAYDEPIQLVILKQVQSLLSLKGLGVAVRAAQQGQLIGASFRTETNKHISCPCHTEI